MYELKNCPVCGASEIKRLGKVIAGEKEFAKYRCPSCDAEFSAYKKYQREMAAAKKQAQKAADADKAVQGPAKSGSVQTFVHAPSAPAAKPIAKANTAAADRPLCPMDRYSESAIRPSTATVKNSIAIRMAASPTPCGPRISE